MRRNVPALLFALASVVLLDRASVAYARAHDAGPPPKPSTPKPAAPKPSTPKPAASKPSTPKPAPPKPSAPKPIAPKPAASKAPASNHTAPSASKSVKPAAFIRHINSNPQLASRLQALLPSGVTLDNAAKGFHTEGEFITALHVAHDLGISFADLKTDLTAKHHVSLGEAIQQLKPGVDAHAAERKARFEGKVDLEEAREDSSDNHSTALLKDAAFVKRIESNSQLASRLQPLLPAGTSLASAARGFHSENQFIAALHAAQNLGIPFAQLKTEMTGRDHDPLAVAIFEQNSSIDALAAAKRAESQARTDLHSMDGKR
jgi:hypothetical protein